jgi:hypothetical protein
MMLEKIGGMMIAGETEVLGENLPQCRFVHHQSDMLCPNANPGLRGANSATSRLSYGTASCQSYWKVYHSQSEHECGTCMMVLLHILVVLCEMFSVTSIMTDG